MPSRIVPGEGPKKPKLILIGEAPGKDEEARGRPFVGRAGRLLRSTLQALGVDPGDCYITNVVKFRPKTKSGTNRKPTKKEVAAHLPRLRRELAARPCVPVVLLGDTAVSAVLGGGFRIASHHGLGVPKDGRVWLVSYHPSAAARFPAIRRSFRRDLRLFLRRLGPRRPSG